MKKIYYFLLMMIAFVSCTDDTEKVEITGVKLDTNQITLMVGDEVQLTATIEPAEADKVELKWSVNHEDVVSVVDGKIVALAEGDAVVTVTTPNDKKATCEVTVKKDDNEEGGNTDLEELSFVPYALKAKLVSYTNSLFKWTLTFEDEVAHNSFQYFYRDGYLLELDIYSTDCNFSKGIPMGDIQIVNSSADDANGVSRLKRKDNKNNIDLLFLNGTVNISKEGNNLKFVLASNGAKYKLGFESTIDCTDNVLFNISNTAYSSTISNDINDNNVTYKQAVYYFGPTGPELYIGDENVIIEPTGFIDGKGKALHIYRNIGYNNFKPSEFDLTGTFTVDKNREGPNVIQPGYLGMWGDTFGSWLYTLGDNYTKSEMAPFISGEITIELNDAKDHIKVSMNCKDDAKPENNSINIIYEGACLYYNINDTGDYGSASAGFYGPFEYDSPNMNWFIQLHSHEYKESNNLNGKVYAFDILTTANNMFQEGITEGIYHFDNSQSLGEMTIQSAEIWNYTNGSYDKDKDRTIIVDGTIEVTYVKDGSERYEIKVDANDAAGNKVSGTYSGPLRVEHAAVPPMANHVFESKDAIINIYYEGETNLGKRSRWTLEMTEKSAKYVDGLSESGLILLIEFFVDGGHTLVDKGVPTGTFEMYETELDNQGFETNGDDKRGIANGAYTKFWQAFQGSTGMPRGWTDGNITINGSGDTFEINVDMKSEFTSQTGQFHSYTIKADYSGLVNVKSFEDDYNPMSKSYSAVKNVKAVSKIFSKTGK